MSYLAEQNIIGSLLLNQSCLDKIYNTVEPQMFTSELLGRIYLEFQRGYDRHYEINVAVIINKLAGDSFPEYLVGDEIKSCINNTVTSASVKSYANIVANTYKARQADLILSAVRLSSDGIELQIGEIIQQLEALKDNKSATSKSLSQIAKENKDKYFKNNESDKMYLGFGWLDEMMGGLEGGDVIVIGARPAVGKSALVMQITSNLEKIGKRVGFYNLEMQEKQIYERFVVSHSGIELTRLRRAVNFLNDEKERFDKANEVLEKQENIVISTGSKTVSEIRSESRHMNFDAIIIDYLQLLRADTSYKGNRYAEVGAISKATKALAMELNIPIILLSQLNRVSEMRETKEPTMAELRESGDIEQDASIILLMWNLDADNTSEKGLKIEKQRQGKTGKEVLKFDGGLMKFTETMKSVKEVQEWKKAESTPFD